MQPWKWGKRRNFCGTTDPKDPPRHIRESFFGVTREEVIWAASRFEKRSANARSLQPHRPSGFL